MSWPKTIAAAVRRVFFSKFAWVLVGALATLGGGLIVVTRPEEAPRLGGLVLAPALYFAQWVIYAAIIVLLGVRIQTYRRTLTPRQDLGFVFIVVSLYTAGFILYYTPFVHEFPEGPVAAVARAAVMFLCGGLGAMYGLSSIHRWR